MRSDYYDPKNVLKSEEKDVDEYGYVDMDEFVEPKTDGLFHIGQSYEETPAETLYCKHCGGREFNVGQGNYYTAIKCLNCGWEACIHED